jgi:hypothetical protein
VPRIRGIPVLDEATTLKRPVGLIMGNFFSNYRDWLKVADTALPQNIFGYLLQHSLGPFRADPFAILPYDDPKEIAKCGSNGTKSFLPEKLPKREGPRPEMIKFMAPNRQISQLTEDNMHQVILSWSATTHHLTYLNSCS